MKLIWRDALWLLVILIVTSAWWFEHRQHAKTRHQLQGFQGWSEDLRGMLEQERELARVQEREGTWVSKSFGTAPSDEEDPFGK